MLFEVGGALLLIAIIDYYYSKIPDILSAGLWIYFSQSAPVVMLQNAVLFFGIAIIINTTYFMLRSIPVIGWGDVLAVPLVLSVFLSAGYIAHPKIISMGLTFILSLLLLKGRGIKAFTPSFVLPYAVFLLMPNF